MSFVSLVYLFCLPLVVLVSFLLAPRRRAQNLFLLAFSLFFYGWWDWRFLPLLLATVLVDWAIGLRIAAGASDRTRRRWLGLSVVASLVVLGTFKYGDFLIATLGRLTTGFAAAPAGEATLGFILPIGISFYTFTSLSYVIDVYRRRLPAERSLTDYALYVSFFPHMVAGPIQRAASLIPQLSGFKRPSLAQAREGAYLVLYGFFQKVAIGDAAGRIADEAFARAEPGWIAVATGLVAFSFQIYGDFAGYSNIARGSAKLLGVELMINFWMPYFATSIAEFWHRWHISLSTFLRDYLYIPLGGSRRGEGRASANVLIVMLLGGLWHGADWKFVVWGGLHGLYLVVHRLLRRVLPAAATPSRPGLVLRGLFVFSLVTLTWVFFRAESTSQAVDLLGALFTLRPGIWSPGALVTLGAIAVFFLPLDTLASRSGDELSPLSWPWWVRGPLYACLVWAAFGGIGGRQPFLYFQF